MKPRALLMLVVFGLNGSALAEGGRTVRYDWLAQTLFESIGEVQEFATRWL